MRAKRELFALPVERKKYKGEGEQVLFSKTHVKVYSPELHFEKISAQDLPPSAIMLAMRTLCQANRDSGTTCLMRLWLNTLLVVCSITKPLPSM